VQTDPLRPPKNTVPSKRKRVISRILNDHEICENPSGSFSIRHNPSGEVMHSVNDPSSEAEALYINQSKLIVKLREDSEEPLRLWDVGLGGATNAMAAIRAYEMLHSSGKERLRPLHIVSFENNLDSLKLALKHPNLLPHIRHPGPSTLVEFKEWNSKKSSLQWTLIEGDFIETMKSAPNPDVIYFDPYSAKTNTSLWSLECFQNIHEKCRDQSIELYTYSSSTAVRAALLGAGFFVARGVGTGPKSETTVALSQLALEKVFSFSLLSSQWLERWKKSHTKFPSDLPDSAHLDFQARILNHPQFAN
ncbi:MAG: tRNA-guanine(34) transglycosylase, partial [Deltaproteobacteria bacterium]|nr:tRNA-guanine(34) transglycosylase [Deltaproteobacteria bacterium]